MLKPKKKITKKEIKKDPLLETLYKAQINYKVNKNRYLRITLGIIVIVAVVLFLNNRRINTNRSADIALGRALVSMDIGDIENAQLQLELLIDKHGTTRSGELANYFLGKIYFDQQNFKKAETVLITFIKENPIKLLRPNAHRMLAVIYKKADDPDRAEEHLRKSVKYSQSPMEKQTATLTLAEFLIKNGLRSQALELVNSILEKEDISTGVRQYAEELSGRLNG